MNKPGNLEQVVVLAPRYPSINQAWMDNYLEQLINHRFRVSVISGRNQVKKAIGKSELDVQSFSSSGNRRIFDIIKSCILNPCALKDLKFALNSISGVSSRLKVYLWISLVRSVRLATDKNLLIHSHSETFSIPFAYFASASSIPFVLTFHGFRPSGVAQLSSNRRQDLYSLCENIIVNTEYAKGIVCKLGAAPSKVIVLPQGIPVDKFEFRPLPLPKSGGAFKILSVGRIHREKGVQYSLLAAARLKAAGINFLWTFVGEGDFLPRFLNLVDKLGLNDFINLIPQISNTELASVYQNHHLFVLSSISTMRGCDETQGVVLQEAQASGCIPIATRIGGCLLYTSPSPRD